MGQDISVSTVFSVSLMFFNLWTSIISPFVRVSMILYKEVPFGKTGELYGFHAFYEEVKSENFGASAGHTSEG